MLAVEASFSTYLISFLLCYYYFFYLFHPIPIIILFKKNRSLLKKIILILFTIIFLLSISNLITIKFHSSFLHVSLKNYQMKCDIIIEKISKFVIGRTTTIFCSSAVQNFMSHDSLQDLKNMQHKFFEL